MSQRPGYLVSHWLPVAKLPSPNTFVAGITTEIRQHYPPNATLEERLKELRKAYDEAVGKVVEGAEHVW